MKYYIKFMNNELKKLLSNIIIYNNHENDMVKMRINIVRMTLYL